MINCKICKKRKSVKEYRIERGYRKKVCSDCEKIIAKTRYENTKNNVKYCKYCKKTLDRSKFYDDGQGKLKPKCKTCYMQYEKNRLKHSPNKYIKKLILKKKGKTYKQRLAIAAKEHPEEYGYFIKS